MNRQETAGEYILPEKIAEIKSRTDCSFKVTVRTGKRYTCKNTENSSAYTYKNFAEEQEIELVTVIEFECREYSGRGLAEIIFKVTAKKQKISGTFLDFTESRKQGFFPDERVAQITAVLVSVVKSSYDMYDEEKYNAFYKAGYNV